MEIIRSFLCFGNRTVVDAQSLHYEREVSSTKRMYKTGDNARSLNVSNTVRRGPL